MSDVVRDHVPALLTLLAAARAQSEGYLSSVLPKPMHEAKGHADSSAAPPLSLHASSVQPPATKKRRVGDADASAASAFVLPGGLSVASGHQDWHFFDRASFSPQKKLVCVCVGMSFCCVFVHYVYV